MKDMLGREYARGQYVAYGGRAGSHGYMAVGRVHNIKGDKVSVKPVASSSGYKTRWSDEDDKAVGLRLPERAVILGFNKDWVEPPCLNCPEENKTSYGWFHKPECPRR